MSTTQQAKARRRQAASGFLNMAPQDRPHYKKRSKEASAQHLADLIARERRIQQGKGKKK
jgi:hypothetical protein